MPQWDDRFSWGDKSKTDSIILPYHEPIESRRTLRFLTRDLNLYNAKSDKFGEREDIRSVSHHRFYVKGKSVFAIYTDSPSGVPEKWRGSEEEIGEYIFKIFSQEELPLFVLLFDIFNDVIENKDDDSMTMYKLFDLESFVGVFRNLQWRRSVAEVGAELLSRLICQHALANTNHRSGIGILEKYFQTFDEDVQIPNTGVDDEWYEWAKEYVLSSKRILTLRRKAVLLNHAQSLGVDMVERKEGILIDLNHEREELQEPDAFHNYTQKHRKITRYFVHRLIERSNSPHLQDVTDDGKQIFLDRLESSQSPEQIENLSSS